MSTISEGGAAAGAMQDVGKVSVFRPLVWLQRGLGDLFHHADPSVAYGLMVTGMGALVLIIGKQPYIIAAALSGFLLVGPVIATGLCELSRRRERGERTNFEGSLEGLSRNSAALREFAGLLFMIGIGWLLLSTIMLLIIFGPSSPVFEFSFWSGSVWSEILAGMSTGQLLAYLLVGGALALAVFLTSAVSVPMIIDQPCSSREAIRTSMRVVLANLPAMIFWAVLVVALLLVGFATALLGMIVIYPLLGHATWHAYRDLVN